MVPGRDLRTLNAFEALSYNVGQDQADLRSSIRAQTDDLVSASRLAITRSRELITRSDRTIVPHPASAWSTDRPVAKEVDAT